MSQLLVWFHRPSVRPFKLLRIIGEDKHCLLLPITVLANRTVKVRNKPWSGMFRSRHVGNAETENWNTILK
jgi:hypothetical protein